MEINNNVDLTVFGSVLEIYQAVSLKAGGQGMRYTCRLSEGRFICFVAKVSVYREIAVTIFLLTIILMVGKFFVKHIVHGRGLYRTSACGEAVRVCNRAMYSCTALKVLQSYLQGNIKNGSNYFRDCG